MWRHNNNGDFNVGYGGEGRRWVITHDNIITLSQTFRKTEIMISDFEETITGASKNDFIFLDPPYKPGEKDMLEHHYSNGQFCFDQQIRLAETLKKLPKSKNIRWAMTNSSHKDILNLYKGYTISKITVGTGDRPGIQTHQPNEVIITNY